MPSRSTARMAQVPENGARLPADHMPPRRCLWTIYLFCILVNVNLTIIIPTAPAYAERLGADASFSGVIVAAMSGIQLIIASPIHWLFQRVPFKGIMVIMTVVGILGNGLYAMAGLTNSRWGLVSARMMVGIAVYYGSAFHYLSCAVGLQHRSAVMLKAVGAFAVGYVVGPLFAYAIGVFCDGLHIHHLVLDKTTMPGPRGGFLNIDAGFAAYIGMLRLDHRYNNPIFLVFGDIMLERLNASRVKVVLRNAKIQKRLCKLTTLRKVIYSLPFQSL